MYARCSRRTLLAGLGSLLGSSYISADVQPPFECRGRQDQRDSAPGDPLSHEFGRGDKCPASKECMTTFLPGAGA